MALKKFIGLWSIALMLIALVGAAPIVAYAATDSDAASTEDATEATEDAADVTEDDAYEVEADVYEGGATAESFRYTNGMPASSGVSLLSSSSGYTWTYSNGTWTCSNGTVVSGAYAMGIDVSKWQGEIDWAKVKASGIVDYVIIRCGYGSNNTEYDDEYFLKNVQGCIENDIPFGIYLYSYAYNTSTAEDEADHVLRLLSEAGLDSSDLTYPVYLDLEHQTDDGTPGGVNSSGKTVSISNSTLAKIAQTFCTRIENAGYTAGVYANKNWWTNYLTSSVFDNYSKWVAQYNTSCTYSGSYDMWQCMSTGSIPGISGCVDINFDYVGFNTISSATSVWSRVYGQDQLDTMKAISSTGWTSSDTVVIATDATYWDALTASALAGIYDCPIILTTGTTLSSQAKSEIKRLGATTAYVCGGPIAISSSVDDQIKAAGCTTVERVYGQDHQATARAIAKRVQEASSSSVCIIATAQSFQDALSISPYAYANHVPIFLTEDGSNTLSSATLSAIKSGGYTSVIIVGGPIAVSSSVESQLSKIGIGSSNVNRLYGQTEYETSLEIAKWEVGQGMQVNYMAVATGTTYYDALAGAALCGKNNSVLVIVSDSNRICLTNFVATYSSKITTGYVFGGPIAVSEATWNVLMRCMSS